MAYRDASLWRAERQCSSRVLMANEPNAISAPRLVMLFILPFCGLLYLVFLGCNMTQIFRWLLILFLVSSGCGSRGSSRASLLVLAFVGELEEIALAIDDSIAYPNLYADSAVSGMGFRLSVVDVGAEGVKRGSTFLEVLGSGHFSATEAAGDGDLDAFCVGTHRIADGGLDGFAVGYAALNLAGNVLSN